MKISNETKRKAIFTFIALKLLEIGSIFGLTFGVYYLGKLEEKYNIITGDYGTWANGFIFLLGILIIIAGVVGLILSLFLIIKWFVKLNWRWSLMLNETHEERMLREKLNEEKRLNKEKKERDDFIKENGYWVGDTVKLIRADDTEEKYLNKIGVVEKVTWWSTHIKGWNTKIIDGSHLKLVKKGRRMITNMKGGKNGNTR